MIFTTSFHAASAAALIFAGTLSPATAIHQDSGVDSDECQWANVVHFGSTCTGTYLGDGIVVSAAHCDKPGSVRFAEYGKGGFDDGSFKISVDEDEDGRRCYRHPNYSGNGHSGPDLMYCILDSNDENWNKLAHVPIVHPMMPTGCERDWLSNQVYNVYQCDNGSKWSCDKGPPVVGVGVGCANAAVAGSTGCSMDDRKRHSVPKFKLIRQENHNGDPTSLYVDDSEEGSGVMSGDSGGPLYVELPDGTWRQIGVLHSSGIGANYAALPNRLRWIEYSSGHDITPCHTWNGATYEYDGAGSCGNVHPLDPEDPPNGAKWDGNQGCSTGMTYATYNLGECGNWGGLGPGDILSNPDASPGPGGFTVLVDGNNNGDSDLFDESHFVYLGQRRLCAEAALSENGCDSPPVGGRGPTGGGRGPTGGIRGTAQTRGFPSSSFDFAAVGGDVCRYLGNSNDQFIPCNDDEGCD